MKWLILFLCGLSLFPLSVLAHGFGERIDLPIPLNLYLIGAGSAVLVSFLLIGLIGRKEKHIESYPHYNLFKVNWLKAILENKLFLLSIKSFFVFILLLIVTAGFIGKQSSAFNIAPTVVWILFSVGITYVSVFFGNIWSLINPWNTLFSWFEKLIPNLSLEKKWPAFFGIWPAVIGFIVYRWVENVFPASANPGMLALLIVLYTLVTFIGMAYFGRAKWIECGDPFSVFFELLSRFSIFEVVTVDNQQELRLRPPAVGIFAHTAIDASRMIFVLFMLSSVAFDGAIATPIWQNVFVFFLNGGVSPLIIKTFGLFTLLGIFTGIYLAFSYLIKVFSKTTPPTREVAYSFVLSLLPIAIVYEVAHFVSLLFIEGQRIIYLASDPFGVGWNVFGTALYKLNFQIINLKTLWNWQVGLIVAGHIVAVYISHMVALELFGDKKRAVRSQYPMLVLMIFYTIFSLWIISQPIVFAAG